MAEFVKLFPTFSFIIFLLIYLLINYSNCPKTVLLWILFCLYCAFSVFLGFRDVYYDVNLDPGIYHTQAKSLSWSELWSVNFPKIDILLQVIMKFYFILVGDDKLLLILIEATIILLIFIGVSLLTKFSPNSVLLVLVFLIFTNTGILLFTNFLRQGLASALFVNIIPLSIFLFKSNIKNPEYKFSLIFLQICQVFSHISSISLLGCLFIAHTFNSKKTVQKIVVVSLISLILLVGIFLGQGSARPTGIYSAYEDVVNEEGTTKLFSKLIIDAIAILILIISNKIIKFYNSNFDLLLMICILLFTACLIYYPFPVMSLRLEYYLNFLIIVALGLLVASERINKSIVRIVMFFSIASMYGYSLIVYEHPSITRYFVF
jgi:hypothetical protein